MSILTAEFDLDASKRVWADERALEIAEEMLKMGLSKEQVSQATKLSNDEILKIASSL